MQWNKLYYVGAEAKQSGQMQGELIADYIKENEGIKIECRGTTLPLHEVDDVAPFKITKEVKYKVERMKAKTFTVYE
jgi:ABC-type sugar transport system substrate-binding protein